MARTTIVSSVNMHETYALSVFDMKEALGDDILGDDMYRHVTYGEGDTMPQAVQIDDNESENVQRIKALILKMTSYEPHERPTSLDVYTTAYRIYKGEDVKMKAANENCTDESRV